MAGTASASTASGGKAGAWAALIVILLVVGGLWSRTRVPPLPSFDQPFYLGIAQDIRAEGRFTNGFAFDPAPDGARASGMRFAPLYPALLAAVAAIDPGLRAGMACLIATRSHDDACPRAAPAMRTLQFLELVAVFWLVWIMAARLSGPGLAWPTLAAALITTPLLLRSVAYLMTEMTTLCLSTAATAAAVMAIGGRRRIAWSAAAGALLGLTALTRPAFQYLVPAAALGAVLLVRPVPWRAILAFVAAAATICAPWLLRNLLRFGRPALTWGYDSHTLVQRIAFDTMSWREYAHAYLCWLPDGTALGRRFLGPDGCDRFGWDEHPNSFYVLGLRHMLPQTLAASGGYEHHLGYLLRHYILAMPVWHAMVALPLALRGAYVAHWWGFLLLPVCAVFTWRAVRRRLGFAIVALPAWFMLAFNALVAVNQIRYNLMLVPAYAIAAALGLRWMLHKWQPGSGGTQQFGG